MSNQQKRYYLAYGSNLNLKQMAFRCPNATAIGTAFIRDYRLLFKGSQTGAYLTIEKKKGETVPVAVWEVDEESEHNLDRYEGFPTFYYKKEINIEYTDLHTKEKKTCVAFVYIMREDRKIGIPSRSYVQACLEGYKSFGFNHKHIEKALKKSIREAIK